MKCNNNYVIKYSQKWKWEKLGALALCSLMAQMCLQSV